MPKSKFYLLYGLLLLLLTIISVVILNDFSLSFIFSISIITCSINMYKEYHEHNKTSH